MKTALLFLLTLGAVLAQTPPPALRVSMIVLGVKDMARSIKFYGETLGLQLSGKPSEVTLFRAGDVTIVLNQPLGRAAENAIAGAVEIVFPLEGVTDAYRNLAERGCNFIRVPHEVAPGMWAATFTDPDGHQFTLFGPR